MNIVIPWGAPPRTPAFVNGVIGICKNLGWQAGQAGHLMACMAFESGGTFSPSIKNAAGSGAVGLIQFMPATAEDLGTTVENLELLSDVDQLYYVQQYFRPYAARIHTLPDMYMAILLPKYIGQPNDAVLFSGGIAYRQNSGLDTDHDGKVTKLEATSRVQAMFYLGLQHAAGFEW